MLLLSFVGGMLTVIPVLIFGFILQLFYPDLGIIIGSFYDSFFIAALNEELFKFVAVMVIVWNSKYFDEKFDGIVYAVYVSLGFALVENILFVFSAGDVIVWGFFDPRTETGILRAFTAVPAHAIFGITMGYFIGQAKFNLEKRGTLLTSALLLPILLHGLYNFIIFIQNYWLFFIFILYLLFLYVFGFRKINQAAREKEEYFKNFYN